MLQALCGWRGARVRVCGLLRSHRQTRVYLPPSRTCPSLPFSAPWTTTPTMSRDEVDDSTDLSVQATTTTDLKERTVKGLVCSLHPGHCCCCCYCGDCCVDWYMGTSHTSRYIHADNTWLSPCVHPFPSCSCSLPCAICAYPSRLQTSESTRTDSTLRRPHVWPPWAAGRPSTTHPHALSLTTNKVAHAPFRKITPSHQVTNTNFLSRRQRRNSN